MNMALVMPFQKIFERALGQREQSKKTGEKRLTKR